jgi:hypothetical protein
MHGLTWVKRPSFAIATAIVVTIVVEFFLLEGTVGVSLPKDRYFAVSTLKIKVKGAGGDEHFMTRNNRFTVVDLWMGSPSRGPLVLRESFFVDKADGVEGPPDANVTVEAMVSSSAKWTFREPGERGEVVTDHLYMVTRFGNGETGNTHTYFSLLDGRKVQTNRYSELSTGGAGSSGPLSRELLTKNPYFTHNPKITGHRVCSKSSASSRPLLPADTLPPAYQL